MEGYTAKELKLRKTLLVMGIIFCIIAGCIGCCDESVESLLVGKWENSAGDVFTFYDSGDFKHDATGKFKLELLYFLKRFLVFPRFIVYTNLIKEF